MLKYEPSRKYLKAAIANTIFSLLGKGIYVTTKIDSQGAELASEIEDGYTIGMTILPYGPYLVLRKENGAIKPVKRDVEIRKNLDLDIQFKNIECAMPTLLGMQGVSGLYAEGGLVLYGDLHKALAFVKLIEITEAYLFPKFITSKIMYEVPKKQSSSLKMYLKVLFGR